MGIVIKEFDGSLVTPKDAAVMNELIFQSYGIFNGCNISFLGVNKIMIASGRMIVKGRQVVITEETIAAQLSSGGTKRGRLYMKIDLSNLDNPGTFLTQVADELPELIQQDDVNYSNGIFEVELCNYDVSETAISNIVETCPMITGSVDLLKSIEEVMANTKEGKAVDALVIKKINSNLNKILEDRLMKKIMFTKLYLKEVSNTNNPTFTIENLNIGDIILFLAYGYSTNFSSITGGHIITLFNEDEPLYFIIEATDTTVVVNGYKGNTASPLTFVSAYKIEDVNVVDE